MNSQYIRVHFFFPPLPLSQLHSSHSSTRECVSTATTMYIYTQTLHKMQCRSKDAAMCTFVRLAECRANHVQKNADTFAVHLQPSIRWRLDDTWEWKKSIAHCCAVGRAALKGIGPVATRATYIFMARKSLFSENVLCPRISFKDVRNRCSGRKSEQGRHTFICLFWVRKECLLCML